MRAIIGGLRTTAIIALLCVLALLGLEGGVSFWLFWKDGVSVALPREANRAHMQPDTLLGWTNRPGNVSPDEYGPGIGIAIGPQGLRGARDAAVPRAGAVRLACSGDSFTLGYGVDDAHAWCARLEQELPAVETLNLGQAAYGWDQAWLRYRRDGVALAPRLQVVALTYVQFERALSTNFDGRFKPQLTKAGDSVAVRGVPVPPLSDAALRRVRLTQVLGDLRAMQWLRTFRRFDPVRTSSAAVEANWPAFDAALGQLAREHRARGTQLVLAYLPVRREMGKGPLDARRAHVAKLATTLGVPFFDLTPALRALPPDSADNAFITTVAPGIAPAVPGHYSNIGNAWVARRLADTLRTDPVTGPLVAPRAAR
jgi:hypothetical protein